MKKKRQLTDRFAGMPAPSGYKWVKIQNMEPTSYITNGCDCYPWTECFFWLPVKTVGGQNRWWEKGYKRKVWAVWGTGFHMEPIVQYATLFELIENKWVN